MVAKNPAVTSTALIPVGAMAAYAGTDPPSLKSAGWLMCDGSALERSKWPDLFSAIGTSNGAPDENTFNLPDCRGIFLRGVDGGAHRDPSAGQRTAPQAGANSGDNAGSVEGYATGAPKVPFTAKVAHIISHCETAPYPLRLDQSISACNPADVPVQGSGGDHETRPTNKYLYFIIKALRVVAGHNVALPIGAVIPYAGPLSSGSLPSDYLQCDGTRLDSSGGFKPLFAAIGTAHGGDGKTDFDLPDLRGYFLRGVSDGATTDPDRSARTVPRPENPPGARGNSGDTVGSLQGYATARPLNPFLTNFGRIPVKETHVGATAFPGHTFVAWHPKACDIDVTQRGGDSETRPINISVNWLIKFRNSDGF